MISKPPSFVNGAPLLLLRAEGLAVALLCVAAFSRSGASWWLFAALILVPDLSTVFILLDRVIEPKPTMRYTLILGPSLCLAQLRFWRCLRCSRSQ